MELVGLKGLRIIELRALRAASKTHLAISD